MPTTCPSLFDDDPAASTTAGSLVPRSTPIGDSKIDGPDEVRRLDAVLAGLREDLERLSDDRRGLQEVRNLIQMHRRERGRMPRRR